MSANEQIIAGEHLVFIPPNIPATGAQDAEAHVASRASLHLKALQKTFKYLGAGEPMAQRYLEVAISFMI